MMAQRDWVNALKGIPGWAVERALDELAVESKNRPTPAAAREKAREHLRFYTDEIEARKTAEALPPPREAPEDEKARVQDMLKTWGSRLRTVPKGDV